MKTVLLVDDTNGTREFVKMLLELADYRVIEASNGEEAIEAAQNMYLDLILMDIAMPVMNGLTATKIIRDFEESAKTNAGKSNNIPIIAVTGFSDYYKKSAIEAGCNGLIAKPIDFRKLDSLVKQLNI